MGCSKLQTGKKAFCISAIHKYIILKIFQLEKSPIQSIAISSCQGISLSATFSTKKTFLEGHDLNLCTHNASSPPCYSAKTLVQLKKDNSLKTAIWNQVLKGNGGTLHNCNSRVCLHALRCTTVLLQDVFLIR